MSGAASSLRFRGGAAAGRPRMQRRASSGGTLEDGDADPLWSKARVNFETNDGSLPTVEIGIPRADGEA